MRLDRQQLIRVHCLEQMQTKLAIRRVGNQVELGWQSVAGREYQVLKTADWKVWVAVSSVYTGTGEYFTLLLPAITASRIFWKLLVGIPQGSELPIGAVTAFSGQYVDLEWERPGDSASGNPRYELWRNGAILQYQSFGQEAFRDTAVASGQRYTYEARFFS